LFLSVSCTGGKKEEQSTAGKPGTSGEEDVKKKPAEKPGSDETAGGKIDYIYLLTTDGQCVLHKGKLKADYDAMSQLAIEAKKLGQDHEVREVSVCPADLKGKAQTSSCSNEGEKTVSVYYEGYAGIEANEAKCTESGGEWKIIAKGHLSGTPGKPGKPGKPGGAVGNIDYIYLLATDGMCTLHKGWLKGSYDSMSQLAIEAKTLGQDHEVREVSVCPADLKGKAQTSSCSKHGGKLISFYYDGYAGSEANEAECKKGKGNGQWKKF